MFPAKDSSIMSPSHFTTIKEHPGLLKFPQKFNIVKRSALRKAPNSGQSLAKLLSSKAEVFYREEQLEFYVVLSTWAFRQHYHNKEYIFIYWVQHTADKTMSGLLLCYKVIEKSGEVGLPWNQAMPLPRVVV